MLFAFIAYAVCGVVFMRSNLRVSYTTQRISAKIAKVPEEDVAPSLGKYIGFLLSAISWPLVCWWRALKSNAIVSNMGELVLQQPDINADNVMESFVGSLPKDIDSAKLAVKISEAEDSVADEPDPDGDE